MAFTDPVGQFPAQRTFTVQTMNCEIVGGQVFGGVAFPLESGFTSGNGTFAVSFNTTADPNVMSSLITDSLSNLGFASFSLGGRTVELGEMRLVSQSLSFTQDARLVAGRLKAVTSTNFGDVAEDLEVFGSFDPSSGQLQFQTFAELSQSSLVPALSAWGLTLLVGLMLLAVAWYARRMVTRHEAR